MHFLAIIGILLCLVLVCICSYFMVVAMSFRPGKNLGSNSGPQETTTSPENNNNTGFTFEVLGMMLRNDSDSKCITGDGDTLSFTNCDANNPSQQFSFLSDGKIKGKLMKHTATGKCIEGNADTIVFAPCDMNRPSQIFSFTGTRFSNMGNLSHAGDATKCLDSGDGSRFFFSSGCSLSNPSQSWFAGKS